MKKTISIFKKYVFVCENERDGQKCCAPQGTEIREKLKAEVKARGFAAKVRVSRTGCLDICATGANVLIMPDNIWFQHVEAEDIPEILNSILGDLK